VDTQDKTVKGYLAGDKYAHGYLASEEFLGNLSMPVNEGELLLDEFISGNYTADEKITAGYAMVTDQLGDKTTMIAGARLEHTNIDYVGYAFEDSDEVLADVEQVAGSGSYTNFLPNLTFQHKVNDGTILNLAFTKTLARPGYFNLVPFKNILIDDEEIEEGNPELEATVSNNIDFTAEKYFSSVGLFSVGVFHKNLDNWLYTFTTTDYTYNGANNWSYSQVRNGKSASVTGLEVALQSKLDFLPGFLSNLTFFGNYTYTDSSTDGVEGRDDVPLVGAVKNMANGSIAYETKKFFLRASTNYSGSAIDEVGGDTWEDRYYDEQFFLDVNAAYTVNKNVRLFAEFKNLTNQPLRYYQGIQERTMQLEYYNFNWNAGVKIDF
jgi:TonB-dependent receptor